MYSRTPPHSVSPSPISLIPLLLFAIPFPTPVTPSVRHSTFPPNCSVVDQLHNSRVTTRSPVAGRSFPGTMDAPLHRPAFPRDFPADGIPPDPSCSRQISGINNVEKKKTLASDAASSVSNSNCSGPTFSSQKGIKISRNLRKIRVGALAKGRKTIGQSDVDALALPLGMSIAAVVSQVLERKSEAGEKMSVDYLSEICILAVRESLENVFGDKFDNFVANFEKSFRSTLMTLKLINDSSQNVGEKLRRSEFRDKHKDSLCYPEPTDNHNIRNEASQDQKAEYQETSFREVRTTLPFDRIEDSTCAHSRRDDFHPFSHGLVTGEQCYPDEQMDENITMNVMSQQLVLRDKQMDRQLSVSSNMGTSQSSMLTTVEKSVVEQTRSNDLKAFEIGLIMKKLQLKEKQLALNSHSNLLERWKLSMGFSKASFKAEKFKTQLQDTRLNELLRRCLDFLVAGLIIMLFSIAYGTFIFSHRRIIEATEACTPSMESKSWWMPKSMSTFNSGVQVLKCQIQALSRILFGGLMISGITFLLIQRSSTSQQTMPLTFMLLLGVMCGYAGKFCIDTLGGSGYYWLVFWEALCVLHFFSNTFSATLFCILYGPIAVAEKTEHGPAFPYWMRRLMYFTTLIILPLLCGFIPFAGLPEWYDHFSSKYNDFIAVVDD